MKLEHEFYDLQDLEKRWSEYGYTEIDASVEIWKFFSKFDINGIIN